MSTTKSIRADIAREHLGIETLETRRSDDLDFHTVSVWGIAAALNAAFEAGARSVRRERADIDVHTLLGDRKQVAVIWSIEDVQSVRPDLTDDQAWEVLQQCEHVHDCEWGFTWTHIKTVADDLFPKQPSTKE